MSLSSGSRLGHYEILEPIGAGGMGEVYRARDTKLGREVAIKTLPEEFSQDSERRLRFEREARLLASLNHPHIATLHGLEQHLETCFLVMELVPGETLEERISHGPLDIDEALPLFQQIAEALAAAHESGVIHRDLKPANIKITPEGVIKILDFGLAKTSGEDDAAQALSESPTASYGATRDGVILGTAPYMSPEQARGKRVDKGTDIWAFGCVFFEALTGTKAFFGESVTDTLAAVVQSDPAWDRLPENTPWRVRDLVERCLRKESKRRFKDMAGAALDIVDALSRDDQPRPAPAKNSKRPLATVVVAVAAAGGIVVWGLMRTNTAPRPEVRRFVVDSGVDSLGCSAPRVPSPSRLPRTTSCLLPRAHTRVNSIYVASTPSRPHRFRERKTLCSRSFRPTASGSASTRAMSSRRWPRPADPW